MPIQIGDISVHMGPDTLGGPDNLETAIIQFIDSATERLDIAVQEIDHPPIAEAIVRARLERNVRVRLVLESDYLREGKALPNPANPGGKYEVNRELLSMILRTSIDAKSDFNPKIFHQKFIIRDRSAVLTGSTNFTGTGVGKNLNHIVVVENAAVAKEYQIEFKEINKGFFGKYNLKRTIKPQEIQVSGVRIKPLFAPDHAPEMEIIKCMNKAKSRVDFAIFTFSQSSGIDDAMITLKELGRPVRGALDRRQANQKWAATRPLKNAGAELHVLRSGTGARKIHHKLMTVDDSLTIVGSFNYTGPANLTNDENILVIGDLDLTDSVASEPQRRIARFARDEIDRIIQDHCSLLD